MDKTHQALHVGQSGNWPGALSIIENVLAQDPGSVRAQDAHAWILINLGRAEEAREAEERACAIDPEHASPRVTLGVAYLKTKSLKLAEAEFEACLAKDPQHLPALVWRCRAATPSGKLAALEERTKVLLSVAPDLDAAHVLRAAYLLRTRDFAGAEAHCRKALERNPQLGEALYLLGHALLQMDRPDAAQEAAQSALRIAPGDKGAQRLLRKARQAAKYARRWRAVNAILFRFGFGPVLAAMFVVFVAGQALRIANRAVPVVEDGFIFYPMAGAAIALFVAIQAQLAATKPDVRNVTLSEDY